MGGGVATPGPGQSEVLLDLDTVLGLTSPAPADYVVYEGSPKTSFVEMFQAMLDDGDTVSSNSWSQCEDETPLAQAQAIDSVLAGAAAAGVTVINGSGDSASSCLDGAANTVGVPADSPHADRRGRDLARVRACRHLRLRDVVARRGGRRRRLWREPLLRRCGLSACAVGHDATVGSGYRGRRRPVDGAADLPGGRGRLPARPDERRHEYVGPRSGRRGGEREPADRAQRGRPQRRALLAACGCVSPCGRLRPRGIGFADLDRDRPGAGRSGGGPAERREVGDVPFGQPQADGADTGVVRVQLIDDAGAPIAGHVMSPQPASGSATVTALKAMTDATGRAAFSATDATAETVTFTVRDTTAGVTLAAQPQVTFVTPRATGALISASPSRVANDGNASATITVYLRNAQDEPAAGKQVALAHGGSAAVTAVQGVTGSDGEATFTVTDFAQEAVQFTATDITDGNLRVPGSATVSFSPGAASPCSDTAPTPTAGGYSVDTFASGVPYNAQNLTLGSFTLNACSGAVALSFDASGNVDVANPMSGSIYRIGAAGGPVTADDALPQTDFQPRHAREHSVRRRGGRHRQPGPRDQALRDRCRR